MLLADALWTDLTFLLMSVILSALFPGSNALFAVSLHLSAYYGQYPSVCVLLRKNLELQRPSFRCPNPARVLRFCLHVVLTLFVVLPASPAVFYELRVCVSWLWPLFCLYLV